MCSFTLYFIYVPVTGRPPTAVDPLIPDAVPGGRDPPPDVPGGLRPWLVLKACWDKTLCRYQIIFPKDIFHNILFEMPIIEMERVINNTWKPSSYSKSSVCRAGATSSVPNPEYKLSSFVSLSCPEFLKCAFRFYN